jgi:hypothetical protein
VDHCQQVQVWAAAGLVDTHLPEELYVPELNLTRDQFQILQGDCDTYIHPIGPSKLACYRFKDEG